MVGSPWSPGDSKESSPTPQFKSINSSVFSFLYSPSLTSIHDYWKSTRQTFVGNVMSLLLNKMSRLVMDKAMVPHSSTIAWKIPWTTEPGRLQSMGLQRVGHDRATSLSLSNYGGGNEDNGDLLQKVLCTHCSNPAAGHCQPMTLPETPGHSWASLGRSLEGSLLLSPGSWCT